MQGKNKLYFRFTEKKINQILQRGRSILMLGPRQVGKTTLVQSVLKAVKRPILEYPLQHPGVRLRLEADPARLIREVEAEQKKPIVFVDEAQKIPDLFDAAQYLIDRKIAQFIFTGSSARKLRRSQVNLLAGRIDRIYLDPLMWGELGLIRQSKLSPLVCKNVNTMPYTLADVLVFGTLPAVCLLSKAERINLLRSYTEIYLEEEIRAEALSRKIGAFARFLELAATESGTAPNLFKLSQESGVSQPAIKEFYRILEDTLIVERLDPYIKNARKRILSSARYYFFDLGVRNALARLPLMPDLIQAQKGVLFEHAVILELQRRIRMLNKPYKLYFWRTAAGAEVDCVIDTGTELIPIEIKSSTTVTLSEIRGLKQFLIDYQPKAKRGFVITMGTAKEKLTANIMALPWDNV